MRRDYPAPNLPHQRDNRHRHLLKPLTKPMFGAIDQRDVVATAVCSVIDPLASPVHDPYFEDPLGKIVDAIEPSMAKTEALWVNVIASRYRRFV
jgi:hypothetical protein